MGDEPVIVHMPKVRPQRWIVGFFVALLVGVGALAGLLQPSSEFGLGPTLARQEGRNSAQVATSGVGIKPDSQQFQREPGDAAVSGLLMLLDAQEGCPIPLLRLRCTRAATGGEAISYTSDAEGKLRLPSGAWVVEAADGDWGPPAHVEVGLRHTVAWFWPRLSVRVSVANLQGHAVAQARVELFRDGEVVGSGATDDSGSVEVGPFEPTAGTTLLVAHADYEPELRSVTGNWSKKAGKGRVLAVVLTATQERRFIKVVDDLGVAMEGCEVSARPPVDALPLIRLGTTDAEGHLTVSAGWPFSASYWELSGASYGVRIGVPVVGEYSSRVEIVVVAPRRGEALLSLAGTQDAVEWRIRDPQLDSRGFGLLYRVFNSAEAASATAVSLPLRAKVIVEAHDKLRCLFRGAVEMTVPGEHLQLESWRIPAESMRTIVLKSLGSPIASVACGGKSVKEAGSPLERAVAFSASREAVSVRVVTARGAQYQLVGSPGDQDAVLTIDDPQRVETRLVVCDKQGSPLNSAIVSLHMRGREVVDADAPGWKILQEGNVVRLPIGPGGEVVGSLFPGIYAASLEHIAGRDRIGASWSVVGDPHFEISGPGPVSVRLIAHRPRRVHLELRLEADRQMPWWTIQTSSGAVCVSGPDIDVWCTEAEEQIKVLDEHGEEVAVVSVPHGVDSLNIGVSVPRKR